MSSATIAAPKGAIARGGGPSSLRPGRAQSRAPAMARKQHTGLKSVGHISSRPTLGLISPPRRRARGGSYRLEVNALGFAADGFIGGVSLTRQAENILRDASSMLIFQSVLRDDVVQAYLKICRSLTSPGDGCPVLLAYGEYYRLLVATGHTSFLDHVLELVVQGNENVFALECARTGELPNKALVAAAAADMDNLQAFCVAESTIMAWIKEVVPSASHAWFVAAPQVGVVAQRADVGEVAVPAPGAVAAGPVPEGDRAAWRAMIGEKVLWSEAIEDLAAFYAAHGAGPCSWATHLSYSTQRGAEDGSLSGAGPDAAAAWAAWESMSPLPAYEGVWGELAGMVARHAAGGGAGGHALLHGPSGAGKSHMLNAAAASDPAIRIVHVERSEVRNLPALGRALAAHPRVRFVVLLDNIAVTPGEVQHHAITGGVGGPGWPGNAMVLASAPRASGLREGASDGGALASVLGSTLELRALSEEEFAGSVGAVSGGDGPTDGGAGAVAWAHGQPLTARVAAGYARSCPQVEA